MLVVCLARPSLLERRPHWGEGQLYHRKIHLEPLTKRESRQLVAEILQRIEPLPVALRELVVSGAEGNPFYVEELVKMLIEQGVILTGEPRWSVQAERLAQVDVPSTLTGVLQARLDGLPAEERLVLQQASVVGRVFWDRALEYLHNRQNGDGDVIGRTLTGLRDKELVFRREESIFLQAYEYIFKHEVLKEVTYETVLKKRRKQYHGWVAEWLIAQIGEGEAEYAGLIADHLEKAGQGEHALVYLRRAGEAALAGYANAEAARYFRRALDMNPSESARPALLAGRAEALQRQGYFDESIAAWRAGITIHQAHGDLEGLAHFYTEIIRSFATHLPFKAVEQSEMALAAVAGLEENLTLGHLLHQAGRAYVFHGQPNKAEPLCRRALEIARRLGALELQSDTLATMGIFYTNQPEEAIDLLRSAINLSEAHHFLQAAVRAHNNLGAILFWYLSDPLAALSHHQRSFEIARLRGGVEEVSLALGNLINTYIDLGNIFAAQERMRELERVVAKMPQPELLGSNFQKPRLKIARAYGQLAEAFKLAMDHMAESRQVGDVQSINKIAVYEFIPVVMDMNRYQGWTDWEVAEEILGNLAETDQNMLFGVAGEVEARLSAVCARQGKLQPASGWLQRAHEQVSSNPYAVARSIVSIAHLELAIAEERWDDSISASTALLEWYTRAGMRWEQAHTLLELAEIHRLRDRSKDRDLAQDFYAQSKAIFTEIGATGYVEIVQDRISQRYT
jgi:predicted ATPase